ncbi:MAG: fibronectin type III domain-containing protein [bacterium]
MKKKKRTIRKKKNWKLASLFAVAVAVILISGGQQALAGVVNLSDIRIIERTSERAVTAWTTDQAADSKVRYGILGFGLNEVVSSIDLVINHSLPMEPLIPNTPYEYRVGSKLDSEDESERTWGPVLQFWTPAGGGSDDNPPRIIDLSVNNNCCSAMFNFATNEDAKYVITIVAPGLLGDGFSADSGEVFGQSFSVPYPADFGPGAPSLQASSIYGYTIELTDIENNLASYGPLSFKTGNTFEDHTFTPGVCLEDGTPINQCNEYGYYCGPGGLTLNCELCGYECQVGETCRNGGACTDDPTSGISAYQCNPPSCYNEDGVFMEPAGPGCYVSWIKCNANTVLKVQKDRVCNKWMTCRTQTEVKNPVTKQTESLCYDMSACAALGPDGNCSKPLFGKYCAGDPLRFCESGADCDVPLCYPTSGKWCSSPEEDDGIFDFKPCTNNDQCAPDLGTCVNFYPPNVTYQTPDDIQKIRYLSGAINVGLTWTTGHIPNDLWPSGSYEGNFPWFYMPQEGSVVNIGNENFEQREAITTVNEDGTQKTRTEYTAKPWKAIGRRGSDNTSPVIMVIAEDPSNQNSPNHILKIDPTDSQPVCEGGTNSGDLCSSNAACLGGGTCLLDAYSGAQAPLVSFSTLENAKYYLSFKIKSSTPDNQEVRPRLFSPDGSQYYDKNLILTTGWQTVITKPIKASGGTASLQFVRTGGSTEPFFIDDVSIRIVLGVQRIGGSNENPIVEYVNRSCRLFPREDSLLCEYRDESGIQYKGWYGYCLEKDSKFTDRCISWWPVDIIGGETDIFGTFGSEVQAGYNDRTPLYFCMEAEGVMGGDQVDTARYRCKADLNQNRCTPCEWEQYSFEVEGVKLGRTTMEGYIQNEPGCCLIYGYDASAEGRSESLIYGCNENALFGSCNGDGPFGGPNDDGYYPVEIADQYEKNEISMIVIRAIEWTHGDWEFGPIVLDESNGWHNSATFAYGNNEFDVRADFNANGILQGYQLYGCDESGANGGMVARVEYVLRERCNKIVKVVNDDGTNKAWSGRLSIGSGYQTRVSNYTRTSDLSPFGGSVTLSSDTDTWNELLFIEAPRDNELFTFPYQTRAGLPAACKGDCSERICIGGGVKDGKICRLASDCKSSDGQQGVCSGVGTCSISLKGCSANYDFTANTCPTGNIEDCCSATNPDDICIGGALSNKGAQVYNYRDKWQCEISGAWCYCSDDGDCGDEDTGDLLCGTYIEGDKCGGGITAGYDDLGIGVDNVQRLFAQSYGFWTWNPELGKYQSQPISTNEVSGTNNWEPPDIMCKTCQTSNMACIVSGNCSGDSCAIEHQRGSRNTNAAEADYCGVRPNVFGIAVNDQQTADIRDGSWVTLKFNTTADTEQQPLSSILINWDETDQQSIYFPYAPKADPASPHVLSHRYFCNTSYRDDLAFCKTLCKNGTNNGNVCTSQDDCPGGTCSTIPADRSYPCRDVSTDTCVFQPRIVVEDNWGWCNAVPDAFESGADCTSDACPIGQVCEPRFSICVDSDIYSNFNCGAGLQAFPPSWKNSDYRSPIEVRVQPLGT